MSKTMRMIVTGGGTGGHIYPALEVARLARDRAWCVDYFGSFRGQEQALSTAQGFPFTGFPSEPLVSPRTIKGITALARMAKACVTARRAMASHRPNVVFSTGGYSSAPVLFAARSLGVPIVLLESNSIPGKTTEIFFPAAKCVCTVFKHTSQFLKSANGLRTGQPVRAALREAARQRQPDSEPLVLVIGGSQGAAFLNALVPKVAQQLPNVRFAHAAGRNNFDAVNAVVSGMDLEERYHLAPYFESDQLLDLYARATLVVGRSGGVLAEFAAFGLPSVLVPLPSAAGNHQAVNAQEFVGIGAASIVPQTSNPDPGDMLGAIQTWLQDSGARQRAENALKEWDIPDATERIIEQIEKAAK